ncbi:RNase P and RNase MRP subunit [Conoideocrella luteorostrata]|uniref:RNase P and RNase MRP subunit n=1 Tax=Conoideocrella luteorostrata TaxID=1105319 RepID=A0AAJ0FXQ6_9HYPO|nr:RNase P and RNase MRP subunit [Conoideocrella luteorostrata]
MAVSTQTASRKRLVHHLDTPFSTVSWPETSLDDQDTILELLCKYALALHLKETKFADISLSLLNPIGQHKKAHARPSKGKRAAKRKKGDEGGKTAITDTDMAKPPHPEISDHVHVGFNSITRELESLSGNSEVRANKIHSKQPYCMIFVARGNQSAAFNCHFPKMVTIASRKLGSSETMRLIGFSKPCSDRLSSCLGIGRVSSLAILKDAPGTEALWTFVKNHVASVDAAWLEEKTNPQYRSTRITSVETTVGVKRNRTSQTC